MEKKKPGRPSIASNGAVCASTMLPVEVYDHICKCATAHGESVSAIVRGAVTETQDIVSMVARSRERIGMWAEMMLMCAEACHVVSEAIRSGTVSDKEAELLETFRDATDIDNLLDWVAWSRSVQPH